MNPVSAIACSTMLRRSFGALGIVERRVARRRLDDAGDRRRFDQREVADVLAEEQPRRFRHAVDGERSALAERDVVQVELEDLVLRQPALERDRHQPLGELAPRRLLRAPCAMPHIELRKVLRTSCCVIVLPPLRYFWLPNMLVSTARVVPMKSTPGWS